MRSLRCNIRLRRALIRPSLLRPWTKLSQGIRMLYDAYEVQRSWLTNASRVASMGAGWLNNPANPLSYGSMGPIAAAGLDVFAHASAPRGKPEFGIAETKVGRKIVAVHEEIVLRKPFGQLKHFRKEG